MPIHAKLLNEKHNTEFDGKLSEKLFIMNTIR